MFNQTNSSTIISIPAVYTLDIVFTSRAAFGLILLSVLAHYLAESFNGDKVPRAFGRETDPQHYRSSSTLNNRHKCFSTFVPHLTQPSPSPSCSMCVAPDKYGSSSSLVAKRNGPLCYIIFMPL
ncbi:hypothetical protein XENORESO_016666 [Xenotaenia resolanae]|uniref:Uncharacterized protein n=1 Tax=Xenotaenia resolanae TaxID=208358 RepID=A0ABV0WRY0_9TELE